MIFSTAADVYHAPYPGEEHDALRVEVDPQHGSHMETLAFYFPVVGSESATLALHWGTTLLEIPLELHRG